MTVTAFPQHCSGKIFHFFILMLQVQASQADAGFSKFFVALRLVTLNGLAPLGLLQTRRS